MTGTLSEALKNLRLSGLVRSLHLRVQEASGNGLSHVEFLELILQDELAVRKERLVARRMKAADFRDHKTLEDFDWRFNKSVRRKHMYDLASGKFVRQQKDVLFVGPPGTGKSHLAQAIGYHAVQMGFLVKYRSIFDVVRDFLRDEALKGQERILLKYLKPDLLIVDDMGLKQLRERSGEFLFEIVMRRYENRSTMMTSDRPIEEWGELVGDVLAATAILDRFLHHAEIVTITGKSCRMRERGCAKKKETV